MLIWGRETNRAFCRKNINLFAQWGDHEFNDDMGFDYSPSLDPDGIFLRGKTAWNAFIGLGQPPNDLITPTDVTAKHWAKPVGDILMVAPDAITNATRASWITGRELATPSGINTTTTPTAFTAMLGANQIADIKAAVTAAKKPFCIFLMGNGGRYVTTRTATGGLYSTITGAVSEYNNSGTQHPIFDHCLTEWQSLVTNDSTGLMANQYTNGTLGSMAWFHSDWHHAAVYTMVHPAYTGHLAENFPSLYHGSTSGGATFTKSTYGNTGDTVGSSVRIDYVAADVAGGHQFGGLIIRVKGSTYPKTIEYDLRDINNNRVFHKKQVHQIGLNNMYDVSNDITNKGARIGVASE